MTYKNDAKAHAKGVVLGLTMAEIAILIIFILLLVFACLFLELDKSRKFEEKYHEVLNRLTKILAKDDGTINEELVKATNHLPELEKKIKDNQLQNDNENLEQVLERGLNKILLEKIVKSENEDMPIEKKYEKLVEEKNLLESKIANIEGQNKNLMKQCKGIGFPPCWANANGSPEYIFNLYLYDDGILIHDNKLPHRAKEQKLLDLSRIIFETPLNPNKLIYQTLPLLEYGKTNDCRFFVQIIDKTGAEKKELYKDLRQAVEANFYILKRN